MLAGVRRLDNRVCIPPRSERIDNNFIVKVTSRVDDVMHLQIITQK